MPKPCPYWRKRIPHFDVKWPHMISKRLARGGAASEKMHTVMSEFKRGQLHSGTGRKGQKGAVVKSRPQAIAIGLSESGQSRK